MKKFINLLISIFLLAACAKTPTKMAQNAVEDYLQTNLKNPKSYIPISFSRIDTLEKADTSDSKRISYYTITHVYSVINSLKDKVDMTISFLLDINFQINECSTKSINGDYSALTGNVYWKYNNYVGNKPDAGANVMLYSLDTIRKNLMVEATADVQGNYKIDKILPGLYFLIIRSENTTDCPERHIQNLRYNDVEIKEIFNFDLNSYKKEINEIDSLDRLYTTILFDDNNSKYGGLSARINKYRSIENKMREKSENLIESFPIEFKRKLGLFSSYSNAFDFTVIQIEESKTESIITDFGTTCI